MITVEKLCGQRYIGPQAKKIVRFYLLVQALLIGYGIWIFWRHVQYGEYTDGEMARRLFGVPILMQVGQVYYHKCIKPHLRSSEASAKASAPQQHYEERRIYTIVQAVLVGFKLGVLWGYVQGKYTGSEVRPLFAGISVALGVLEYFKPCCSSTGTSGFEAFKSARF